MAQLHLNLHGIGDPVTFIVGQTYTGTTGDDVRSGTAHDDTFNFAQGGNDTLSGENGNDVFHLGAAFTPFDRIDGGKGDDTLVLNGDYFSGGQQNFQPDTIHNIETIRLTAGFDYIIVPNDANVAANKTLTIDGSHLGPDDKLLTTGNLDTDSLFVLKGGDGDDGLTGGSRTDHLFGGAGDDELAGFPGADFETGGKGHDTFTFVGPSDSTGKAYDTVTDFNADDDIFNLSVTVTHVDHDVLGGALHAASFNGDLEAAIGKDELGRQHAVLFHPVGGDLAGHVFLIVDGNGRPGYQANKDFVIDVTGGSHLGQLHADNFISDIG